MSPTGAIIMSVFAAIWWAGALLVSGLATPLMYAVGVLATLAVVYVAWRSRARVTPALA